MTSSPSRVSPLLSPPSFCDNPWLGWWGFPRADNQKIYNVTELLEFTVLRVNFDGSFKPLHSDKFTILPVSLQEDLSDFQWSFENIKRQSKLTLSSQIIISSLRLSSNFLTLKFSLHTFQNRDFENWKLNIFSFTWRHKHLLTGVSCVSLLHKAVFPPAHDIITHSSCVLFPRPSQALSSHVVKIPPKCGVTSGSHSSGVYYLK